MKTIRTHMKTIWNHMNIELVKYVCMYLYMYVFPSEQTICSTYVLSNTPPEHTICSTYVLSNTFPRTHGSLNLRFVKNPPFRAHSWRHLSREWLSQSQFPGYNKSYATWFSSLLAPVSFARQSIHFHAGLICTELSLLWLCLGVAFSQPTHGG